MRFKPYPKYKHSGVEWLGDIPHEWIVQPLKQCFRIVGGSTPKSDDGECWNGDIVWVSPSDLSKLSSFYINDSQRKITEKGLRSCGTTLVPKGSIVLSTRAPIGSIGIADVELCTNQGCKSLVPEHDTNSAFFAYLLSVSTTELNVRGKGTTFLEISGDELGSFKVGLPLFDSQVTIATFLDRETAKIDALINKQEKLIELLKEKRQAVISHAVTKGLDPTVPMKDSGVEWLGDGPEHWAIHSLKFVCDLIRDGTHLPPARVDDGVPLLSVRNIQDGKFILRDDDSMISEESYSQLCKSFNVLEGDVLLAIVGATLGKVAMVRSMPRVHIQRSVALLRADGKILFNRFLEYFLRSTPFQNQLWSGVGFSAQPGIYLGSIIGFPCPIPSIHEQERIVTYLDNATAKIDTLIAKADQAIALQKEHRTALISAAVTGKIDVRNEVPMTKVA